MSFLFKTTPYAHQLTALERSADEEYWALLMSMRTGKSKVIYDNAAHLYGKGKIDALVVVAPKGVHRNWIVKELPTHLSDSVPRIQAYWRGLDTKRDREAWERLFCSDSIPLRVVTFNYDAVIHPKGKEQFKRVLTTFRCMLAGDESHRFKTQDAQRTKIMLAAARYAAYRRILTGTFLTQGPLDTYTQLKFLDPELPGYTTYTAFKAHYAQMEPKLLGSGRIKLSSYLKRQGIDPESIPLAAFASKENLKKAGCRPGRDYFDDVVGYQNMPELHARIAPYATVVRASDCVDLPAKVYQTLPVELTPEQRRVYRDLLEESVAYLQASAEKRPPAHLAPEEMLLWFIDGDDKVVADNAMSRALRLQQVVGGFATTDDGTVLPLKSERLPALLELLDGTDGKVIVWARFKPELHAITAALQEQHGKDAVVRYYGGVGDDERAEAVRRLDEDPSCRFFVSNPQAGGIGLPLHAADTMVYYSKDYNLDTYLQSEERASKVGKENSVLIVDMQAEDTIDAKITDALQKKRGQSDAFYEGLVEAGA